MNWLDWLTDNLPLLLVFFAAGWLFADGCLASNSNKSPFGRWRRLSSLGDCRRVVCRQRGAVPA